MHKISEKLKENSYVFSLPIEISFADQQKIIQYTTQFGFSSSRVKTSKQFGNPIIWKALDLRSLDKAFLFNNFPNLRHLSYPALQYILRYRTDLKWNWIETPITSIVRDYWLKASKYFLKTSRVTIILLIPGASIPPHIDPVSGSKYDEVDKTVFFHEDNCPELTENQFHQNNHFLSFKIPISSKYGDNGLPYIRYENNDYYFNVKQNLYCMKEAKTLHGVDACDFWRGIIYLDGELDTKKIFEDALPVEIKNIKKLN